MANSNLYCGTVSADGGIISNGNFSCESGTGKYTVKYNTDLYNPVPVITSRDAPLKSTMTITKSNSSTFIVEVVDRQGDPVNCGFNFVVAQFA